MLSFKHLSIFTTPIVRIDEIKVSESFYDSLHRVCFRTVPGGGGVWHVRKSIRHQHDRDVPASNGTHNSQDQLFKTLLA